MRVSFYKNGTSILDESSQAMSPINCSPVENNQVICFLIVRSTPTVTLRNAPGSLYSTQAMEFAFNRHRG
jgi:hypothetical protein